MFPRSQPHNNQLDITANLINALRYTRRESFRDFRAGLLLHRAQGIVEFKRYCKDQASVPKPADSSGTSSHVTPPRERRNFSRYRSTRKSTRSAHVRVFQEDAPSTKRKFFFRDKILKVFTNIEQSKKKLADILRRSSRRMDLDCSEINNSE